MLLFVIAVLVDFEIECKDTTFLWNVQIICKFFCHFCYNLFVLYGIFIKN